MSVMAFGKITFGIIFIIFSALINVNGQKTVIELNEDNWNEILKGEWMVEFYAPWCPACKALEQKWKEFAHLGPGLGIKVGSVDVTTSPGLSGRFIVTALPTIFHVINGEFRQYKGVRDKESFTSFIEDKKWEQVEPVPSWKSPDSIQMGIVSSFFKLSQFLRHVHNKLTEEYGLPSVGSYLIFAVATIFLGALLGLILVCAIDLIYPPKHSAEMKKSDQKKDKESSDELDDEDIKDDLVDDQSGGDHNSGTDSGRDVCISGICKKVGCDWVVGSTTEEDDCGICQGDGSKCDKKEGMYDKQNWSPGYKEIVVIPRGARNILIEEIDRSENYISIGSALARKFYLNGERHISLPGEYTVAGTQALYGRDSHLEKIRIHGPILEPIVVYIYFRGKSQNPGVYYRYSIWKQEKTKQLEYSWTMAEWTQCSATCGGGVQHREPVCQESAVSSVTADLERPTPVDEYFCEPSEKPEMEMRTCNDDACAYKWWVGPWQACPETCSKKGKKTMKRRSVVCVDDQETALPDYFCDKRAKPLEYKLCTPLPKCE